MLGVLKKISKSILISLLVFAAGVIWIYLSPPSVEGPAAIGVAAGMFIFTCFFTALTFLYSILPNAEDLKDKSPYVKVGASIFNFIAVTAFLLTSVYLFVGPDQIKRLSKSYSPPKDMSVSGIFKQMIAHDKNIKRTHLSSPEVPNNSDNSVEK